MVQDPTTTTPEKRMDADQQRFNTHSHQLFTPELDNVECLRIFTNSREFNQRYIFEKEALQDLIDENNRKSNETFYIVRQLNTLSRLLISQEGLQFIIDGHNISSRFLRIVTAFGARRHDENRAWDSYRISPAPLATSSSFSEISYVIRYVERHDRSPQNPWSVRQIGVYQQILGLGKSTWVLLQPPDNVYHRLKDSLENRATTSKNIPINSCLLHLDILESVSSSWSDYIEYSWSEVDKLDDKACLLEMGYDKKNDYVVVFKDCQRLQRLRRRLLRARSVLESNLALVDGIAARFPDACSIRIENYKAEIDRHRRNLLLIIEHLRGTSELLFNILNARNDKFVLDGTQAMRESLGIMGRVAEQGQVDSATLKLLSMIATIYLPASLVATIFSSNLIQLKTDDTGSTSFQPVSQFWIYIVLAVALTLLTFLCVALVLRREIIQSIRKYWSAA
ncbi:hypothetical protein TWF694_004489 [Orbilia ellipsospora]|uniref:CorA-like transporter domain-containing protein n=1 Tax=Orbilia ellipsospora TaxID=2528407 RepID=A0AAV9WV95_9PEZI